MGEADLDLEQLLSDPLVRLMMSSDAVQESDIRRLACQTRRRIQARRSHARPPLSTGSATAHA